MGNGGGGGGVGGGACVIERRVFYVPTVIAGTELLSLI